MTAQTSAVSLAGTTPSIDRRTAALLGVVAAAIVGLVLAPAMMFFIALATITVIGLDRAAQAANKELASIAAATR
jgi:hypothetical protein